MPAQIVTAEEFFGSTAKKDTVVSTEDFFASGMRLDGTPKGPGYFGTLKRPDGNVSTELSAGFNDPEFGGKETQVPLLVPTLTKGEIDSLLAGKEPTPEIYRKAKQYALDRIKAGKSPFAKTGEQGSLPSEQASTVVSTEEFFASETPELKTGPAYLTGLDMTPGKRLQQFGRLFKGETWKNVGKNILPDAGQLAQGITEPFTHQQWMKKLMATTPETAKEEIKTLPKQATEIPKSILPIDFIKKLWADPVKTFEDNPAMTILMLSPLAGKAGKAIMGKMSVESLTKANVAGIFKELAAETSERIIPSAVKRAIAEMPAPSIAPIAPEVPGAMVMRAKKKLEGVKAPEVSPEIKPIYEDIQTKIDNKIDELTAKGKSFEEANENPEVNALYEQRNAIGGKELAESRSTIRDGIKSIVDDDVLTDKILKIYSLGEGTEPTAQYMAGKYTQRVVKDRTATGEKISREIANDFLKKRGLDERALDKNVSGWTESKIGELRREFINKTNKVLDSVERYFEGKPVEVVKPEPVVPAEIKPTGGLSAQFIDEAGKPISYGEFIRRQKTRTPTATPVNIIKETDTTLDPLKPFMAAPIRASEPLEIVKQKTPTSQPVFKHELDAVMKLPELRQGSFRAWTENPIRIFDENKPLKEMLYNPIKVAERQHAKDIIATSKEVKTWRKELPGKSNERLWAHSVAQQKNGPETLQLMGVAEPTLTAKEMTVYNKVQADLGGWLEKINRARELSGVPPLEGVENYFTFYRNLDTLRELGHNIITEPDVNFLKRHLNAPAWKFQHERAGIIAPLEKEFFGVYQRYVDSTSRYVNKAPIVSKGRMLLEDFKLGEGEGETWNLRDKNPRLANYITSWIDFQAGQKPPSFLPEIGQKVARAFSRNVGAAVLSYNGRTFAIQLTSLRLSYVELGKKWLAQGIWDNLNPVKRLMAMEKSNHLLARNMDVTILDVGQAGPLSKRAGILGKVARTLHKAEVPRAEMARIGTKPLRWLDMEAARETWLGAYARGKGTVKKGGLGLSDRGAIQYADDVTIKTQASASPSDLAPIQRSPEGRMLTIFQTFNINETNQIWREIMGPGKKLSERTRSLARLTTASLLVNALFEGVLNVRSPLPAPEWEVYRKMKAGERNPLKLAGAAAAEMTEQIPVIGSSLRYQAPGRSLSPAPIQLAEDTFQMVNKIIFKATPEKLGRKDIETVGKLLGIPGTGQVMKYIDRRKKGMSHVEAIMGVRTEDAAKNKLRKVPY